MPYKRCADSQQIRRVAKCVCRHFHREAYIFATRSSIRSQLNLQLADQFSHWFVCARPTKRNSVNQSTNMNTILQYIWIETAKVNPVKLFVPKVYLLNTIPVRLDWKPLHSRQIQHSICKLIRIHENYLSYYL